MGQPPPSKQSENQLAQQQADQYNEILILAQTRLLIEDVLKQLAAEGEDMTCFKAQMKKNIKDLKRGENFQGRVDNQGRPYGILKIFERNGNKCTIYIGQITNGVQVGQGIYIKNQLHLNKTLNQYEVNQDEYEANLLQEQDPKQPSIRKGCLLTKNKDKQKVAIKFFKGYFQDQQLYRGKLKLKQNDIIKIIYSGEYKNNSIHGYGSVTIPGKYKYEGTFQRQTKTGMGQQYDQIRQTSYLGEFEVDRRHGYGELTYHNRDNTKLKGFWTDGVMKTGDGMYVSKDGTFLEMLGEDIVLL